MYLSDFLRGGQTLQGEAGPYAIAANDLLEVNQFGQLSTVTVSDYAAVSAANTAAVAATTALRLRSTIFGGPGNIYQSGRRIDIYSGGNQLNITGTAGFLNIRRLAHCWVKAPLILCGRSEWR